jgi:tetratricopeptide (TPR) repeat protein
VTSGFLENHVGRDARAVLSTILPELRASEPDLPAPPDVSPERMTFELAQAVVRLLNHVAEPHGLMVILDDLHHADEQSLAVSGVLAREISRAKVLFAGTYRDAEVGRTHPLAGVLSDLSRLSHYERITLSGLARDDVARLLSQSKEGATYPLDSIMAATDGNSLFVTEIIRASAGQPKSADKIGPAALLPRSLREVILGRLRVLSADCRNAVEIASVIGREFDPETVELVGAFDADTVDGTVDEALRIGVFAPVPDGIVRFAHALIRDAIYDEMPRRRRIALHRTIAQVLSASRDFQHESSSHPETIAYHFQEAGLVSEAIDYWEQAANVALHRSAHGEQIRRLEQALHLLSTTKPSQAGDEARPRQREIDEREIQLRLALGNAHTLVDGASSSSCRPEFAAALELCNRYMDAPELERPRFMAVNGLWSYHVMRCDTDELRELVTLQSELAERANSESYRLVASNAEAITRFYEGDFARSLETLDGATQRYNSALARRIARGTAGPWRTSAFLSPTYYAWCLALVGRGDEAERLAARTLAEARQLGTHAHVQALTYVAAVFETTRDVNKAREVSQQIIELAETFGYSSWIGSVGHCVSGWARSCLGEAVEGLAQLQQGFDTFRATGEVLALTYRACFCAETLRRAGKVADAAQLIDATLQAGRGRIEHFFDAELLRTRGDCDLARDDTKGAIAWFRRARDLAHSQSSPLLELRATSSLALCGASDKRLVARLRELKEQLVNGIGEQDLDDATRALAAAKR